MLSLTRKENQSLTIQAGDHIVRVHVVAARGGKVRLGVEAAPEVSIFRTEIIRESHDALSLLMAQRKAS